MRSRSIRGSLLASWATLLSVAGALPARAQQHRALVIGIDRYQYAPPVLAAWRARTKPLIAAWREQTSRVAGPRPAGAGAATASAVLSERTVVTDLDGAVNDAVAMAEILRTRFGFTAPDTLTNQRATRANILDALHRLAATSGPGDIVAFYYAGHGSQRVNSAGRKDNHLDQTIVPADANAGQFDIRDVELNAAFGLVLDAIGPTGRLTLIFDSCHSGMLSRGGQTAPFKIRWAAADPRDAADPTQVKPLEERGALFIAAAQDFESAQEEVNATVDGKPHGAFTSALLRVLHFVPQNEPATQVFARVLAIVQENGRQQHPTITGIEADPRRALFGTATGPLAGKTVVSVLRVDGATVRLRAGLATGLARGTELHLVDVTPSTSAGARIAPVRLRVTAVRGLGESDAEVVSGTGTLRDVRSSQLYAVDRWALPDVPALRVWVPPARDVVALAEDVAAVQQLRTQDVADANTAEFIADPTTLPDNGRPLYTVRYGVTGWQLVTPSGRAVALARIAADVIRAAIAADQQTVGRERGREADALRTAGADPSQLIAPASTRVRFTVLLPLPSALSARLRLGKDTENAMVERVTDPRAADYLLAGRLGAADVRYGWIRPNATEQSQRVSGLPARTASVATDNAGAADSLTDMAVRLARVRGWLTLASPPDTGVLAFPYRLALRDTRTHAVVDSGVTHGGDTYDLVLRRDPAIPTDRIPARWIYVFTINSEGTGVPLFPSRGLGGNRIPVDSAGARLAPVEVTLTRRSPIRIVAPYGVDTFLLVSTEEPIDPEIFRFDGVRGGDRGPNGTLETLFSHVGRRRTGGDDVPPSAWSVQTISLRSGPAGGDTN